MKILMLSWEYPPKSVGGLAEHVCHLSRELARLGNEVHVITCEEGEAPEEERDNGVYLHRVSPIKLQNEDFIKWVMHLNFSMIESAASLISGFGRFDLLHAHDWLSMYSARTLKKAYALPMVCTVHSTESGRNSGIRTDVQRYISSAEWMLTYEAWKVVVCGHYMRQEIHSLFSVPLEKIWVIPNGIDPKVFQFDFDWLVFRRQFAMDYEKIVFYVGRHVYEKGLHVLAEAATRIIGECRDVKFVIAGTGPMTGEIKNMVCSMGVQEKFYFPGYIDSDTKNRLYRVANVAVFPSLYEPFGIVALEAMASGCPAVVSEAGGLGELVRHGENGLKALNGNAQSLADNIITILKDMELANQIRQNARQFVNENYTWDKIAATTCNMYRMVMEEERIGSINQT